MIVKSEPSRWFTGKLATIVVIGIVAVAITAGIILQTEFSKNVIASPNALPTPNPNRHFVATKRIIVDQQTGKLRMPTTIETDKLVEDLSDLTKRPTEGLKQITAAGRGTSIDLDGGYAGTMIARPNADGTTETRCVFTFEEAADFLGLVEGAPTE